MIFITYGHAYITTLYNYQIIAQVNHFLLMFLCMYRENMTSNAVYCLKSNHERKPYC